MSDSAAPVLQIEGLRAGYGRIEILHGISLDVRPSALCAIVGANGAGKSTLLLTLSRLLPVRAGSIRFDGRDITRAASHDVVRAGLVHVPEGRHVLASMTVRENLQVAAAARAASGVASDIERMHDRFPILRQRAQVAAGSLSGGEQQMLAIARALIVEPRALLLDEPSMGLAPKLVDAIFDIIAQERARGTTIVLVEQNARRALQIADYAYVLERGTIALHGRGPDLLGHEEITRAYLGTGRT